MINNIVDTNAEEARKLGIVIPTYEEMQNPNLVKDSIKNKLKMVGINDVNSVNLFRTTWKNDPVTFGTGFGEFNYGKLPSYLTGVKARIVVLGKWFPTGAHKAGALISCIVPRLVTGRFNLRKYKTAGNYCRGGVFNSCVLEQNDIIITVATDSVEMYQLRLQELEKESGVFSAISANIVYNKLIEQDWFGVYELSHLDRKRIHNLKYYTWVEQREKTSEELSAQWNESYWKDIQTIPSNLDVLIKNFNALAATKESNV
ncbi:MAG: hypothetical protein IJ730_07290 [Alphaproteobacteria bacterium]|nr:hypothetical protein [Alphaproteobacteria bacterium]